MHMGGPCPWRLWRCTACPLVLTGGQARGQAAKQPTPPVDMPTQYGTCPCFAMLLCTHNHGPNDPN